MKFALKILGFLLLVSLSGCEKSTITQTDEIDEIDVSEYFPNVNVNQMKPILIDIFLLLTMGSEYNIDIQNIRKWKQDIKYFIIQDSTEYLVKELDIIIQDLHVLIGESVSLKRVFKKSEANFIVILGKADTYKELFPESSHFVENKLGFYSFNFNDQYEIEFTSIYIDILKTDRLEQRHILREEFTQAMGIPNDLDRHVNSIFYAQRSKVIEFSAMDKAIIKILYHPRILNGMGPTSCRKLLNQILKF